MRLPTLDKQGFAVTVFGFQIHLWQESEVSFHICSCGIQYKIIADSEGEVSHPSCVVCGVEFEIRGTPLEIYPRLPGEEPLLTSTTKLPPASSH
jgi:hypothetical protein